jgi:transcriptional regulator with XRE-family HTH domain
MEKLDKEKAREINLAIARYFKSQGITQKEVARRLGYASVNSVSNQIAYGRFGKRVAAKWAKEFGFSENYLMTGRGSLLYRQSSYRKLVQENEALNAIVRVQRDMLASREK